MRVLIPSALLSYTAHASEVGAEGKDVGAMLQDLERRYPGIRFRIVDEQDAIRPHMRVFVDGRPAVLATPISPSASVAILMALSGG